MKDIIRVKFQILTPLVIKFIKETTQFYARISTAFVTMGETSPEHHHQVDESAASTTTFN
jgi:6,7-dimethyl-8-ribityllumazine synthase